MASASKDHCRISDSFLEWARISSIACRGADLASGRSHGDGRTKAGYVPPRLTKFDATRARALIDGMHT
eukprot:2825596-Pleurochrysis_carterae.AAC.1